MRLILPALLCVVLCSVACDSGAGQTATSTPNRGASERSGVYFPVQKPIENRNTPASFVIGDLVEVDGCLRVNSEMLTTNSSLIIWPPGFSHREQKDGIQILDPENHVVASVGDSIYIDGGELNIQSDADKRAWSGSLMEPLPEECPGPYWFGGNEVRREPSTPSP